MFTTYSFFRFTYLVCPLIHPRFKREFISENLKHKSLPLTRSDLLLSGDCKCIIIRFIRHSTAIFFKYKAGKTTLWVVFLNTITVNRNVIQSEEMLN